MGPKPTIRLVEGEMLPDLSLGERQRFHIFLSHVWSSGQDQVATIKRQLQLVLPGTRGFLDVDDLDDIERLDEYVATTGLMLLFVYLQHPLLPGTSVTGAGSSGPGSDVQV